MRKNTVLAICFLFFAVLIFPQTAMATTQKLAINVTENDFNKQYFILLQPNYPVDVDITLQNAKTVFYSTALTNSFDGKSIPEMENEKEQAVYEGENSDTSVGCTVTGIINFRGVPTIGKNVFDETNSVIAFFETDSGKNGIVQFIFLCADWYSKAKLDVKTGLLTGLKREDGFPTSYKIGNAQWNYENKNDTIKIPSNIPAGTIINVGWPKNYTPLYSSHCRKTFITNMNYRYKTFAINKQQKPSAGVVQIFEADDGSSTTEEDTGEDDDEFYDDEDVGEDDSMEDEDEEEEDETAASPAAVTENGYQCWFKLPRTYEYYIGTEPDSEGAVWQQGTDDMLKVSAKLTDHLYIRKPASGIYLASDWVDCGFAVKRHTWSTNWYSNASSHWKASTCIHPGLKGERNIHVYGPAKTTKAATTKSTGISTRYCKVCGYRQDSVIPKVKKASAKKTAGTTSNGSSPSVKASQGKVTKTSITVKWSKIGGATGYCVYGAKGKGKAKKLATVKSLSWTQKKLKKNTYYNYYIVALSGSKTICKSNTVYIATDGGKNGNYSKVTFSKKKLSVKKGKKTNCKAKGKTPSGKKVKSYSGIKYKSSNTKIATVTTKGVIKGVGKGTCTITATAQNGKTAQLKVTVK